MNNNTSKQPYLSLEVKTLKIDSSGKVICTSGGRNNYEEEDW